MSDEDDLTIEEMEDIERIATVYARAIDLCTYTVTMMNLGKFGIACDDDKIAITFIEKVKEIIEVHTGDSGSIKLEYHTEGSDDGASGGSETDNGEESRELRPSNRKLH